jgi:hypothetical protein
VYDHCIAKFPGLEFLQDKGIHSSGQMVMLEEGDYRPDAEAYLDGVKCLITGREKAHPASGKQSGSKEDA